MQTMRLRRRLTAVGPFGEAAEVQHRRSFYRIYRIVRSVAWPRHI